MKRKKKKKKTFHPASSPGCHQCSVMSRLGSCPATFSRPSLCYLPFYFPFQQLHAVVSGAFFSPLLPGQVVEGLPSLQHILICLMLSVYDVFKIYRRHFMFHACSLRLCNRVFSGWEDDVWQHDDDQTELCRTRNSPQSHQEIGRRPLASNWTIYYLCCYFHCCSANRHA